MSKKEKAKYAAASGGKVYDDAPRAPGKKPHKKKIASAARRAAEKDNPKSDARRTGGGKSGAGKPGGVKLNRKKR